MKESKENFDSKMLRELVEIMSFSKNSLLMLRKEIELIGYSCMIFMVKQQFQLAGGSSEINQKVKNIISMFRDDFLHPTILKEMYFLDQLENYSDISNPSTYLLYRIFVHFAVGAEYIHIPVRLRVFLQFPKTEQVQTNISLTYYLTDLEQQKFVRIKISSSDQNYELLRLNVGLKDKEVDFINNKVMNSVLSPDLPLLSLLSNLTAGNTECSSLTLP